MKPERWHKKDAVLTWNGRRTSFAVAQELFSSHEIDAGSRLLLRSLDLEALPPEGNALDFGCGYGVLGLALREHLPGWQVFLVDRDALATGFARWNAARLGLDDGTVRATVGLGVDDAPDAGWDLVLWNVPGKAGEAVLAALMSDVAMSLAAGGMAALVVVNPLAAVVREALVADPDLTIELDQTHPAHTVIHARRATAGRDAGDPFDRGVFDREQVGFGVDDFDYDLVPVYGLPEYDSYSYSSQLVFDLVRGIEPPVSALLVQHPGQGHVPLVVAHRLRPSRLTLMDRDQLALRASVRALAESGPRIRRLEIVASPDLVDAPPGASYPLVILLLEDQVRNEVHVDRIGDLAGLVAPLGTLLVAGSSSTVSRFLSFVAKAEGWKVRDRVKRSGASAARIERVGA